MTLGQSILAVRYTCGNTETGANLGTAPSLPTRMLLLAMKKLMCVRFL